MVLAAIQAASCQRSHEQGAQIALGQEHENVGGGGGLVGIGKPGREGRPAFMPAALAI
jgi:hypothetical protein